MEKAVLNADREAVEEFERITRVVDTTTGDVVNTTTVQPNNIFETSELINVSWYTNADDRLCLKFETNKDIRHYADANNASLTTRLLRSAHLTSPAPTMVHLGLRERLGDGSERSILRRHLEAENSKGVRLCDVARKAVEVVGRFNEARFNGAYEWTVILPSWVKVDEEARVVDERVPGYEDSNSGESVD